MLDSEREVWGAGAGGAGRGSDLRYDLEITLDLETCDWLTQPAVQWLALSAKHAMEVEFDRYIAAGDLSRALERLAREQAASDAAGGFLGMNL